MFDYYVIGSHQLAGYKHGYPYPDTTIILSREELIRQKGTYGDVGIIDDELDRYGAYVWRKPPTHDRKGEWVETE